MPAASASRWTGNNPIMLFEWWANWNPNNPNPADQSGQFAIRLTITYPNSGPATVRLRVTDSLGLTSAATLGIMVQ